MSQSVDITDLVEKARSTFVDWGVAYIYGQELAIPGMEWVALPVVSSIDKAIIRMVLDNLSKSEVMIAFFLATAVRKATQAAEFTKAVTHLNNLPEDVSDEEYNAAERARMVAFRDFVVLTN